LTYGRSAASEKGILWSRMNFVMQFKFNMQPCSIFQGLSRNLVLFIIWHLVSSEVNPWLAFGPRHLSQNNTRYDIINIGAYAHCASRKRPLTVGWRW
jgi:hypothetical protein